jgi:hypothetical protein
MKGDMHMKSPNESAVEIIKNYIYYLDEIGTWYGFSFLTVSNSKWAAKELIDILSRDKLTPPLCAVERFRDEMYRLSTLNEKTEHIFATAVAVSNDIIDQLINN